MRLSWGLTSPRGLLVGRKCAAPFEGPLLPFGLLEGGADADGGAPPQLGLATLRSVGVGPCDGGGGCPYWWLAEAGEGPRLEGA